VGWAVGWAVARAVAAWAVAGVGSAARAVEAWAVVARAAREARVANWAGWAAAGWAVGARAVAREAETRVASWAVSVGSRAVAVLMEGSVAKAVGVAAAARVVEREAREEAALVAQYCRLALARHSGPQRCWRRRSGAPPPKWRQSCRARNVHVVWEADATRPPCAFARGLRGLPLSPRKPGGGTFRVET